MRSRWRASGMATEIRSDPSDSLSSPCSGPGRTKAARQRLELSETAFVVCSFGLVTPRKLNDRLLEAWLASPLAQDEGCCLIFVGANDGGVTESGSWTGWPEAVSPRVFGYRILRGFAI